MEPLSSSAAASVASSGDKILKSFTEEGSRPSLEQIDRWCSERALVNIVAESLCGERTVSLSGRISSIGPYRSEADADALLWMEGHRVGVYVRNITSYRVETIKEVVMPLLVDPSSKKDPRISTVTLLSHGERFALDQERLKESIPYFKTMLEGGFMESGSREIDTSSWLSETQLKQIIMYIEDQLVVDKSNVVDLFVLSDFLGMEELNKVARSFLIQNITQDDIEALKAANPPPELENFLENIRHEIIQFYRNQGNSPVSETIKSLLNEGDILKDSTSLSLDCREISYEGSCHSVPYLLGGWVENILRIFKILGGNIESLDIFNVNDSDILSIVEGIKGNSQIKSLDIIWYNGNFVDNGLTDAGVFLLADCINSLTSLRNLTIWDHRIGDEGLKRIASALAENTSIERLDLSSNQFSSEGFDFLLEELLKNKSIKILKLTTTGIGSGLKRDGRYVQLLSNNEVLKELYIGNNCIHDEGAEGFAEIIRRNATLKKIYLWGNRISLVGKQKLEDALRDHNALYGREIRLNLQGND